MTKRDEFDEKAKKKETSSFR